MTTLQRWTVERLAAMHRDGPRWKPFLRAGAVRWTLLFVLAGAVVPLFWVSCASWLRLAMIFVPGIPFGMALGATLRDLAGMRAVRSTWTVYEQVIDWRELDRMLASIDGRPDA